MNESALEELVGILRRGGVIAVPTETQFGLLADALNPEAVTRVAKIKRRSPNQPIAVLLPNMKAGELLARPLEGRSRTWAERYWPGPLTVLAHVLEGMPEELSLNGKIGMRVPGPSVAFDLVRAFGAPLTATSANRSGEPPSASCQHLLQTLGEDVDNVVMEDAPNGAPSTIIDATIDPPRVLRVGPIDPLADDAASID